jgi:hypothetical protein
MVLERMATPHTGESNAVDFRSPERAVDLLLASSSASATHPDHEFLPVPRLRLGTCRCHSHERRLPPQAFSLIEERVGTRVVQRPARNIGPDHRAAERFIVQEAPRALVAFSIPDVSVPALPTHMRPDCAA